MNNLYDMVNYGPPKKRPKTTIFPDALFLHLLGFTDIFRPQVPSQTLQKAPFYPRSYSKSPNHALEKVLTSETPCICRLGLLVLKMRLEVFVIHQDVSVDGQSAVKSQWFSMELANRALNGRRIVKHVLIGEANHPGPPPFPLKKSLRSLS